MGDRFDEMATTLYEAASRFTHGPVDLGSHAARDALVGPLAALLRQTAGEAERERDEWAERCGRADLQRGDAEDERDEALASDARRKAILDKLAGVLLGTGDRQTYTPDDLPAEAERLGMELAALEAAADEQRARAKAAEAERDAERARALGPWDDDADEWSDAIDAAFPTRSGSHAAYATALEMVGHRRTKGALLALVNWLLVRVERAEAALAAERKARALAAADWDAAICRAVDSRDAALAEAARLRAELATLRAAAAPDVGVLRNRLASARAAVVDAKAAPMASNRLAAAFKERDEAEAALAAAEGTAGR